MTQQIKVTKSTKSNTVDFVSDIAEFEWFDHPEYGLGVKVDGRGFYPYAGAGTHRGQGKPGPVRRVASVEITFVPEK